ncbi:DUF805 domain-containing protein [Lysinimonas soli]|uniref:DUF805 domain-containing protein n=1 Tax=Lysinimonas soli TaxID=1074233 RepID=A0ABW0NQ23_9MICO
MTFFESIKTVFRKYAEFTGRATRPEFWWWVLFSTLVSSALNALSIPLGIMRFGDYGMGTNGYDYGVGSFSLSGFWSIAVLLPSLAVTVRRLRDAGRKWTELFWVLLPIAGVIVLIVHLCDRSVPVAPVAGAAGEAAPPASTPPAPPAPPTTPPTA